MREYDHIPRPDIEQHFHIRELIENQNKRTEDRNYHREKDKQRGERIVLIKDSKLVCVMDFWCNKCKEDFKFMAVRQVEIDWTNESQYIAFYRAKCDKGHWCIRLITDKNKDGFYQRSKLIAVDRAKHHNDTIQPWETGFNLLYGNKNK